MRNFRKTRKRGGIHFENVYKCPRLKSGKKSAISTCKKSFATKEKLTVVPIPDDGDCFFTSLSEFGRRTANPALNKDPFKLRQELVDSLLANFEDVKLFISNNDNDARAQISSLRKKGRWNVDIGDIVSQYAAKAFNINILLYDVKEFFIQEGNKYYINESNDDEINLFTINNTPPSAVNVKLFRVNDSHFELLWPTGMPIKAKKPGAAAAVAVNKKNHTHNKSKSKSNSLDSVEKALANFALKESKEAANAASKAAKEAAEAVRAVEIAQGARPKRGKPKVAPPYQPLSFENL